MRARSAVAFVFVVALSVSLLGGFLPPASAAAFSTNVRVNAVTAANQVRADVAVGTDGTIHVVWEDFSIIPGKPVVVYAKSTNGGLTWTPGVPVDPGPIPPNAVQKSPSIALSSGPVIHVVWLDLTNLGGPLGGGIVYTRSTGGPFSPPLRINDFPIQDGAQFVRPEVGVYDASPCKVHVIWSTDDLGAPPAVPLNFDYSGDCGSTFVTDLPVEPGAYDASLAVASDGAAAVAYILPNMAGLNIVVKIRRASGSWFPAFQVNDVPSTYNKDPSVALQFVPPGTHMAHLAWADWRYGSEPYWWDWDIFYSKVSDTGVPYPDVRVVDTSPPSDHIEQTDPSVGLDALGNPRISWTDWRNDPLGHRDPGAPFRDADVRFSESFDLGGTFSANQRVNDDATNREQSLPRLADYGNEADIVWHDERDVAGDFNVYFAATGRPVLQWCDLPGFMTDGVDPDSGDTSTLFTFCVVYRSPTNTPPAADNPLLFLTDCEYPVSGSPFATSWDSWVPGGSDYRTGALYVYRTTLACGVTYEYHFEATDALGRPALSTPSLAGPDVSGWSETSPASSPPARKSAAMAFDSESGVTILFGGIDAAGSILRDTWAYNHSAKAWQNMNPFPAPRAAEPNSLVATYDNSQDRVIVFASWNWGTAIIPGVWAYDYNNNQWEGRARGPGYRIGASMAYDPTRDRTVLFGGRDSGSALDETWDYYFAADSWIALSPTIKPPPRSDAAMVFDVGAGRPILFGGRNPDTGMTFHDTWEYDHAANTWVERSPGSWPAERYGHSIAYDTRAAVTLLFGGSGDLGDTWQYTYAANAWTSVSTPVWPNGRSEHTMAYDTWCGVVVLFGGERASATLEDTWTLVVP